MFRKCDLGEGENDKCKMGDYKNCGIKEINPTKHITQLFKGIKSVPCIELIGGNMETTTSTEQKYGFN